MAVNWGALRLRLNAPNSASARSTRRWPKAWRRARCRVRGGGYRAVLSGIGGDEFMGGVPDPRAHLADLIVQFKLVSLAKHLTAWSFGQTETLDSTSLAVSNRRAAPFLGQYWPRKLKSNPGSEKTSPNAPD